MYYVSMVINSGVFLANFKKGIHHDDLV